MRRRFLIYALFCACIVALTWADKSYASDEATHQELRDFAKKAETIDIQSCCGTWLCESDTAVSPPRPTSFTATGRTLPTTKRNSNTVGYACTVVKSGRILDQKTIISSLNSLRHYPSGLSETIHHLISLGKLVI